jgi:mono/diheme cytochrome c family protein
VHHMIDQLRSRRGRARTFLAAFAIPIFWALSVGPLPLFSQAPHRSLNLIGLESEQVRRPEARADVPASAISLFRAHCISCHGEDGRGDGSLRTLPDFTNAPWQGSRSDQQLGRSILEGKGKSMPAMKGKLSQTDIAELVVLIRAFQGGRQHIPEEGADQVLPGTPERTVTAATQPDTAQDQEHRAVVWRSTGPLFQRSCRSCHGGDGKGEARRRVIPELPDFSNPGWHERRTKAELKASILAGKGAHMPGFGESVSDEQARSLVELVRMFNPTRGRSEDAPSRDFDKQMSVLREEFESLRREYRALSPLSGESRQRDRSPDDSRSGTKAR